MACYLVESATLPTGEVEAQEIGLKQPSLASLGSVLMGAAAGGVEPRQVGRLLQACQRGRRPDGSIVSVSGQRPTDQTSWALAQLVIGVLDFGRDKDSVALVRDLRNTLLGLQDPSGAWTLRGRPGDDLVPVLSLYPALALVRCSGRLRRHGGTERALDLLETYVSTQVGVPQSVEDGLALLTIAEALRPRGRGTDWSAVDEQKASLEAVLLDRISGNEFPTSRVVVQGAQPLWHVSLDRQFAYLLTRRIWPPLHPINVAAASALLAGFDQLQGGWRAETSRPGAAIYSWATVLGLMASRWLEDDLTRHGIDQEEYQARMTEVDDMRHKYDVVISFSGAQRGVAEAIAHRIKAAGFTVFYDFDRQHDLLGEELSIYLQKVYFSQSKYAVAILSKDFVKSKWAGNWEWRAILARMQQQRSAYLLPYFYETVTVDGLNPTIGHLTSATHSPEQFADVVIRKLRGK